MTDITESQQSFAVGRQDEADAPFLRRILVGLVAATVLSGAVTLGLVTQQEIVEGLQVASTHGPA